MTTTPTTPKVGVIARKTRVHELAAYLDGGVTQLGEPIDTYSPDLALVIFEAPDEHIARRIADRFGSGLFGARVLLTPEAVAKMVEELS